MRKKNADILPTRNENVARTPEAKEQQMVGLAVDLAETQLREGTASSQVITHYLKLGTSMANLEKEKAKLELELIRAKTDALKAEQKRNETYDNIISVLRSYSGRPNTNDTDEYDDDLY